MKKITSLKIALTLMILLLPLTSFTSWVQANPKPSETRGTVLYVSSAGAGACTSWADTCGLQAAITAAVATDEIWVQAGTYKPTGTTDRTISFALKNGVAMYGGFAGTETTLEQRNWVSNPTILSGDIGTPTDNTDNSYHVVYAESLDATAILDGFTITAGYAFGGGTHYYGAGIYNSGNSNPSLTNLIISDNKALLDGGGMFNLFSNPSLTNVTFSDNLSYDEGGGMFNSFNSTPSLTNVTFSNNSAVYGGGMMNKTNSNPILTKGTFSDNSADLFGGGIYNDNFCNPTLNDVTFLNNSALRGGGKYNNDNSSPLLTDVTFTNNTADMGAGMFNTENSAPSLTDVTFSANTADSSGGGIYNYISCDPTLTNVTFSGNSAPGGGGITNDDHCSPTLTNVTLSGNTATYGGGLYNLLGSNPTLTNVTLTDNQASVQGGGIYNLDSVPTITNAILWGNTGGQLVDAATSILTQITYSDIQGGYTGEGNIDLDPLLGPLADNGGATMTHYLGVSSPAIDTGSPSVCPATDQRGRTRPIDGDGVGAAICDMGAYEHNPRHLFVDKDAAGLETGLSWTDAFTSMQTGIAEADPGSEVWVAEGTYLPTDATDRTISFVLKNGVTYYGGFAATETALEQRVGMAYPTILSGDIGTPSDPSDNSYHVVYGNLLDAITILDGFTITAGNADGSSSDEYGGGMLNDENSSPTLSNLTFSDNTAVLGGGLYNSTYSSPTLENVTFFNNSATDGGGMYNLLYSSPALTNVTFSGNIAIDEGGGMYTYLFSDPTLVNVTFYNNTAFHGGAMYNYNTSIPTLTNSIVWGQIFNDMTTPIITYSDIAGGHAGEGNIAVDPLLGPLADNGGFTLTHALLPGSPAIDTGSPSVCPATDQRGITRPIDGDENGTPRCDMGAYEYEPVIYYGYIPLIMR